MKSITKTLIDKNFQYKKSKVTNNHKESFESLFFILTCLKREIDSPLWMQEQEAHYLINSIHAAKDRIKELCLLEESSIQHKFELVTYFLLSSFLCKDYKKYKDVEWINDFALNNRSRAMVRLAYIIQNGSKNDIFQAILIRDFIESLDTEEEQKFNVNELFNLFGNSSSIKIDNELAMFSALRLCSAKISEVENLLADESRHLLAILFAIKEKNGNDLSAFSSHIKQLFEFQCDQKIDLLRKASVLDTFFVGYEDGILDLNFLGIQQENKVIDFFDEVLALENVENNLTRKVSSNLQKIKERLKNSSLLTIRPHMLAGKSNLFDIEYLTSCIESICEFERDKTVAFVVNDTSYFDTLNYDNLFILSFNDLASDDFYQFTNSYKHLSTNHLEFEQFSIASYFLINSLVEYVDAEYCHIIEGDTLLLRGVSEFDSALPDVYLSNRNTCCFAKVPRRLLSHYCDAALKVYRTPSILNVLIDEHDKRQKLGHHGGFNDMTLWEIIENNRFGLRSEIHWERCDLLLNESICDHFYHKSDKAYLASRGLPDGISKTLILLEHNGDSISFEGKKIKVIKGESNIEVFYITDCQREVRVNTVQFGGNYKVVMVHIWEFIKSLKEGVAYV